MLPRKRTTPHRPSSFAGVQIRQCRHHSANDQRWSHRRSRVPFHHNRHRAHFFAQSSLRPPAQHFVCPSPKAFLPRFFNRKCARRRPTAATPPHPDAEAVTPWQPTRPVRRTFIGSSRARQQAYLQEVIQSADLRVRIPLSIASGMNPKT